MKILTIGVLLLCVTACSRPDAAEQKQDLTRQKGEWTHAQTEQAIDLYLDGLKQEEALLKRNQELQRQLEFFDENRCSRAVLKARRAEIDSMRHALDSRRRSLR